MVHAVAFETNYNQTMEFDGGKSTTAKVRRFVIMTRYGTAHFKISLFPRSVKVFADWDISCIPEHLDNETGLLANRKALEKAQLYKRMIRDGAHFGGGGPLVSKFCPVNSIEQFMELYSEDVGQILANQTPKVMWERLVGQLDGNTDMVDDIFAGAEMLTSKQTEIRLKAKAEAMALTDDLWGIF